MNTLHETKVVDIIEDELPVYDMKSWTDSARMETKFRGKVNIFDEVCTLRFTVSNEYMARVGEGQQLDLIIQQARNGMLSGSNQDTIEIRDVPLHISELEGYSVECFACGNEASISTRNLQYGNIGRTKALLLCLCKLHPDYPDPFLPCRNIYIPWG